jgi:formyltetrahydrofolate deformylase
VPDSFILIFSCNDKAGIQSKVSTFLYKRSAFLTDVKSFSDSETHTFFSRVVFNLSEDEFSINQIKEDFNSLAAEFDMDWEMDSADKKIKTIIAVSKYGHCLNDLLFRAKYRNMPIEIVGVVSNHEDFREIVEFNNIEFHYLPIEKDLESKVAQENLFQEIVTKTDAELVVLARYMQILTEELSDKWFGKCINIHHSFLPSFKGADPYQQAFRKGVKIIGATAHYVTPDLDEGPIIEQNIERISHYDTPEDLIRKGNDIESIVLARAVRWHAEKRVLLNGNKTVVLI